MELFSIASGSSGNCICVGNDTDHVFVDCGISGRRIEEGANAMGYTTSDMDGILVTHEHLDHIAGLGVVARRYGLPIYATRGTIAAIKQTKKVGTIDDGLFRVVQADQDFWIGSIRVHPIEISHDAAEPVAYVLKDEKSSVGVLTDLGIFNDYIVENMKGLDAVLVEANHDIRMLEAGAYPYHLKRRIASEIGHLSNEMSGQLLGRILHDGMKRILLGHLSKENNYEALCMETVSLEITLGDNPYKAKDFSIAVAARDRVSERIVV
ncbi:MAG: MBL fold metallo-hydrolase [Lachnospiraceae bacterium]|nr:MBL fold metallo-hydrolase [Lachnospiraceae bacterium]